MGSDRTPRTTRSRAAPATCSSTRYKLDGTRLWRIDLGPNIRAGAHYTQFIVFDVDGDGNAEMAVKTAPGTRDGTGAFLSMGPAANDDDAQIYRNARRLRPDRARVPDGVRRRDRRASSRTVAFDQARGTVGAWGDNYGNRVDRFLATAAYLDDSGLPSFVMARGYYTRTTLTAWNWRDGAAHAALEVRQQRDADATRRATRSPARARTA